jgi:AcrR family transcriptional regulator
VSPRAKTAAPTKRPRQFAQARSQRTYEALLESSAKLFAERGYDATQTPDIARAAGVATGAYYRYFDDKRQAFLEVMERHLAALVSEAMADLRPERFIGPAALSPRDGIAAILDVLFKRVRRHASMQREFLSMSYRDPEVMAMRMRAEGEAIAGLTMVIEGVIPKSVVAEARPAAVVVFTAVMEVAANTTGIMPVRTRGVTDKALFAALCDMVFRYLYPAANSP